MKVRKATQTKQPIRIILRFLLLFLFTTSAAAAVNEKIEMFVETPAPGHTITGVLFTRGWAVAHAGIARVELYIDGTFILEIPLGESRPDLGDMYPSYPGSDTSGFNIGLFYSRFANGPHTATVRAIDTNGDHKEASNSFTITRFDTSAPNNFLRDPSKVDLTGATVSLDGNAILISGMIVDGVAYTVRVEWNTTSQGLAISQITKTPSLPPEDACTNIAGNWTGSESGTITCCVAGDCETIPIGWGTKKWPDPGSTTININQSGCNINYSVTLSGVGTFTRTGTINENNIHLTGQLVVFAPFCSETQNSVEIVGTVNGNQMNWQGEGAARATCDPGYILSCTGHSTTILTR
jgi:hypothetical protein